MAFGSGFGQGFGDGFARDESDLVTVPDVVGDAEASAVAELEGAGFPVVTNTAFSDSVASGNVISQSPSGGSQVEAGSLVLLTISGGPQPQPEPSDEVFTGGFVLAFEREKARRERERREQLEREEEAERIQEETTRQIALLLREQEAKDARRAELARLSDLVARFQGGSDAASLSPRVEKAIRTAAAKQTAWALFQLEREMARAQEEEEFMSQAVRILLDD